MKIQIDANWNDLQHIGYKVGKNKGMLVIKTFNPRFDYPLLNAILSIKNYKIVAFKNEINTSGAIETTFLTDCPYNEYKPIKTA